MKVYNTLCKYLSGLLLFISIFSYSVFGQTYTESRKIIRSFKVENSTTVDITNKYGKIHIIPWDEDSVKFEIDLTIKAQSNSRLRKLNNSVDFDFTGTAYYITAKTIFGNKYNSFLSDLRNLAETLIPKHQIIIDYIVKVPNNLSLKINNKYGDIFTDNYNGDIDIVLSNGDLKANNLNGKTNIDLKIGDGVVNSISSGKLIIAYSEFYIKKAADININSRSSRVTIDSVEVLNIQSRRDKYYISEINNMFGDTYFSYLWVYMLNDELNFKMKYGTLNLEMINPDFSFLNVNSEFADQNWFFDKNSSYQIDITHKFVKLNYPTGIANLQEKNINNDENQFLTYGIIGTAANKAKVNINAIRCDVNIIHK